MLVFLKYSCTFLYKSCICVFIIYLIITLKKDMQYKFIVFVMKLRAVTEHCGWFVISGKINSTVVRT